MTKPLFCATFLYRYDLHLTQRGLSPFSWWLIILVPLGTLARFSPQGSASFPEPNYLAQLFFFLLFPFLGFIIGTWVAFSAKDDSKAEKKALNKLKSTIESVGLAILGASCISLALNHLFPEVEGLLSWTNWGFLRLGVTTVTATAQYENVS